MIRFFSLRLGLPVPTRSNRRPRFAPRLQTLEDRTVPAGGLVGDLVIFGDSLSDVGNYLDNVPPGSIPNPDLYSRDGQPHRGMSNGAIWVDTLAEYLGEPVVRPSWAGGLNYAVSGANVLYPGPKPPFNVIDPALQKNVSGQVADYLDHHHPAANDLFVVFAGAKDLFDSLSDLPHLPPGTPLIDPGQVAARLVDSLETLAGQGAQRFVVPNLPGLGVTPLVRHLGPGPVFLANQWTTAYYAAVATDLAAFEAEHPGTTVVTPDFAGVFGQIAQPGNPFGIDNWTEAVGPLIPPTNFFLQSVTQDPEKYFFYDAVHPTAKAHRVIGLEATTKVFEALGVNDLVVTDPGDAVDPLSGGLTLREAINLANAMDGEQTISFNLGLGRHQIDLGGTQLSITDDLTIDGPGVDWLAVSGNGASRVFYNGPNTTATISGLTITHGLADGGAPVLPGAGGGILNQGTLTLSSIVVSHNRAVGASGQAARGGGVFNDVGSTLTVTESTFAGNQANGGTGGSGNGGGIYSAGSTGHSSTVTADSSTFAGNQALGGDGGGGNGGAIVNGTFSQLDVTDSLFTGNQARAGNGGIGGSGASSVVIASGGAIRTAGAGAVASITGSRFTNNQAVGGDGGKGGNGTLTIVGTAFGGAIAEFLDKLTVSESVFTHNQAVGGDGGTGGSATRYSVGDALGGAIFVANSPGNSGGFGTINNSTLTHNTAVAGAGNLPGSGNSLASSVGGGDGGAIATIDGGKLTVTHSRVAQNRAIGGAGAAGLDGGGAFGGGIGALFATAGQVAGGLFMTNNRVAHNQAIGGAGAAGHNGGTAQGGGVYNSATGAEITGNRIVHNQAIGGIGGAGGDGGNGQGGGVYTNATLVTLSDNLINHNEAVGGGGAGGDGGDGQGGGLYNSGTAKLTHDTIAFNRAQGGTRGRGGASGDALGGGAYNTGQIDISADDLGLIFGNKPNDRYGF